MIKVLDHGFVELDDCMATDLSVVNSARVSFGKRKEKMEEGDIKLISFLMKNRHGCFDGETEVLTNEGWKFWTSVTGKEQFLTRSLETDRIEWQSATNYVNKFVDGPMIKITNKHCDLLVTPGHNMVAKRRNHKSWNENKYSLIEAQEFVTASHRIPMGGGLWDSSNNSGSREKISGRDGEAFLLGFFIGDGHFSTSIDFHLHKSRKIAALYTAAKDIGYEVRVGKNDIFRLITDKDFRELIRLCYNSKKEKKIPSQVLDWDVNSLKALWNGLMESDGYTSPLGKSTYSTTSYELAGQLQELGVKIGMPAVILEHKHKQDSGHYGSKIVYRVIFFGERNSQPRIGWTTSARKREVQVIPFRGQVYCVTVPNGTLYVRRNGKPVWCGNTPFEHNSFRFHIKAPIFVVREWQRHRIGSFNEYSLRYSEAIMDFYIPKSQDLRKQVGKPGHYSFEQITDEDTIKDIYELIKLAYQASVFSYEKLIKEDGVAKELARIVLPVGIYTEFYWTVNARSLMNFISLRAAETAQFEIREYAKAIEEVFKEKMPHTHKTFIDNGRVAP